MNSNGPDGPSFIIGFLCGLLIIVFVAHMGSFGKWKREKAACEEDLPRSEQCTFQAPKESRHEQER